jgi:hypothetical protein
MAGAMAALDEKNLYGRGQGHTSVEPLATRRLQVSLEGL